MPLLSGDEPELLQCGSDRPDNFTVTRALTGERVRALTCSLVLNWGAASIDAAPQFFIGFYWTVKVAVLLVVDCVLAVFLEPELSAACALTM